jgi:hypothetical protein
MLAGKHRLESFRAELLDGVFDQVRVEVHHLLDQSDVPLRKLAIDDEHRVLQGAQNVVDACLDGLRVAHELRLQGENARLVRQPPPRVACPPLGIAHRELVALREVGAAAEEDALVEKHHLDEVVQRAQDLGRDPPLGAAAFFEHPERSGRCFVRKPGDHGIQRLPSLHGHRILLSRDSLP